MKLSNAKASSHGKATAFFFLLNANCVKSLSSVYSKFRSLNLPTDPVERTQLLDTISPHSPGFPVTLMQGIELDELAHSQSPNRYEKDISLVPKDAALEQSTRAWEHGCDISSPILGFAFQYDSLNEQLSYDQAEGEDLGVEGSIHSPVFQTTHSDMHPGTPWCPPNNSTIYESCDLMKNSTFERYLRNLWKLRVLSKTRVLTI